MEWPLFLKRISCSNSSSVSWGVKTAVGSSMIMILAPLMSTFMISIFCIWPTERSLTLAMGSILKLYFFATSSVISTAFLKSKRPFFMGSTPRTTFSATVRDGISIKCWWTIPIPFSMASRVLRIFTSFPSIYTFPVWGVSSPNSTFISVVFPAPFSPTRARISLS